MVNSFHEKRKMIRKLEILVLVVFVLFAAVRLWFILTTDCIDDEAYYAMFARHLSTGYIDAGPVIAWLIKLSTLVFGENPFSIRVPGFLLVTVLSGYIYLWSRRNFGIRIAVIIFLLISTTLIVFIASIIQTPDMPMIVFFVIALTLFYDSYFKSPRYFLPAGLFLGLAVLSKISVVFPALGIVLFPVIMKKYRGLLKNRWYYMSLAIACLIVSPFIVWNFTHNFAFVRYQGAHVFRSGGIGDFLGLWLAQAAFFFPILFYYAVSLPFSTVIGLTKKNSGKQLPPVRFRYGKIYFALCGLVPLVYFGIQSMFSKYEANWPAPAFIGGMILACFKFAELKGRWKALFTIQILVSSMIILVLLIQILFGLFPLGNRDITDRYYTYGEAMKELAVFLGKNRDLSQYRIAGINYQIPSMVNLYVKPDLEALCIPLYYHDTLYSFIYKDSTLIGQTFLVLLKGNSFPNSIKQHFGEVKQLTTVSSKRKGRVISVFSLWMARNYKGLQK